MKEFFLTESEIQRFWKNVQIGKENDCWNWTASIRHGYGQINIRGFRWITSRLSWIINFGEIPNGLNVLHKCDNPKCVNPKHLFLGTIRDNNDDKLRKGRATGGSMPGEENPSSKLTVSDVEGIKRMRARGKTISEIARTYLVSRPTVNRILTGKNWSQL